MNEFEKKGRLTLSISELCHKIGKTYYNPYETKPTLSPYLIQYKLEGGEFTRNEIYPSGYIHKDIILISIGDKLSLDECKRCGNRELWHNNYDLPCRRILCCLRAGHPDTHMPKHDFHRRRVRIIGLTKETSGKINVDWHGCEKHKTAMLSL